MENFEEDFDHVRDYHDRELEALKNE